MLGSSTAGERSCRRSTRTTSGSSSCDVITGAYDPRGRHGPGEIASVLRRGLPGAPALRVSDPDMLRFAVDRPPARVPPVEVRCAIDGTILNLPSLATALGLDGPQTAEAIVATGWRAGGTD